MKQNIQIV